MTDDFRLESKLIYAFMHKHTALLREFESFDDCFQELALTVCKRKRLFDPSKSEYSTFIYLICANRCKMKIRDANCKKRKPEYDVYSLDREFGDEMSLLDILPSSEDVETSLLLNDVITDCSELCKEHYILGFTQTYLSKKYNVSQKTIHLRLSKELERLKKICTKVKKYVNFVYFLINL